MSYDKYTSPPLTDLSMAELAKYGNQAPTDISLLQSGKNLTAVDPATDVSLGTLRYNDRPIAAGPNGKNAATYGASFGHTLVLQSRGAGGSGLFWGEPAGAGELSGIMHIVGVDDYAPRYKWHYDSNVGTGGAKVKQLQIQGFDAVNDFKDITTGHSGSSSIQQHLESTEGIVKDGSFGSTALKYTYESGGNPEGFGNIAGAELWSADGGPYATLNINITDFGGVRTDVEVYYILGWTTNRGDNIVAGYESIVSDQIVAGNFTATVLGNHAISFSGFTLDDRKILSEGAWLEDIIDPVHGTVGGRVVNHQALSFVAQVSLHVS